LELSILCNELGKKPTDPLPDNIKRLIAGLQLKTCNNGASLFVIPQLITYKPNEISRKLYPPQFTQESLLGSRSTNVVQKYIDTATIGNGFVDKVVFDNQLFANLISDYDAVFIFNKTSIELPSQYKLISSTNDLGALLNGISKAVCDKKVKKVLVLYNMFDEDKIEQEEDEYFEPDEETPKFPTNVIEINALTDRIEKIEHKGGSWSELYKQAGKYIMTQEEHGYDHPSAFCWIICAAQKAIEDDKSQEMYDKMSADCPGTDISQNNLCRLKVGHEHIWNSVRKFLLDKNGDKLEELEEGIMEKWKKHLGG
jgi:hypothetical protein